SGSGAPKEPLRRAVVCVLVVSGRAGRAMSTRHATRGSSEVMNRGWRIRGTLRTWAVLAALVVAATSARAHEDPAGCFETGPAIIVSVFRANGTTGVVGNVSNCETIIYQASLQKATN